jgi:hypothetical protein
MVLQDNEGEGLMKATKIAGWVGAAVLGAAVVTTPAQASTQGIYVWEFGGYFSTNDTCAAAHDPHAVKFRCDPPKLLSQWALWNAYYD